MTDPYRDFLHGLEDSLDYWTEGSIIEFTEDLHRLMGTREVSQAELARRIDRSPAYITKVLHGGANFTLRTMTKLAMALGAELHLHIADKGLLVEWVEVTQGVSSADVNYEGTTPSEVSLRSTAVSENELSNFSLMEAVG